MGYVLQQTDDSLKVTGRVWQFIVKDQYQRPLGISEHDYTNKHVNMLAQLFVIEVSREYQKKKKTLWHMLSCVFIVCLFTFLSIVNSKIGGDMCWL